MCTNYSRIPIPRSVQFVSVKHITLSKKGRTRHIVVDEQKDTGSGQKRVVIAEETGLYCRTCVHSEAVSIKKTCTRNRKINLIAVINRWCERCGTL